MAKNESKGYWVYIVRMKDGRLYVGHTIRILRRSREHLQGEGSRTTKIFGFNEVIYTESHPTLISAVKRERQLKRWTRAKKLALAAGDVARLKALSRSRKTHR